MVIFSFERTIYSLIKKSGGDGAVDTPVPIPNTEVKHRSGENISLRQDSEPPGFFCTLRFLFTKYDIVIIIILLIGD